jgi:predicted TPR repeat methyltransferase
MKTESPSGWKARLYERYTTGQVMTDVSQVRAQLDARMPYLRQLVRRYFPENRSARILDLGCGYGALLFALRNAGYDNISGVDVSPEQVEAACALGDFDLTCADLLQYLGSLPSNSVDVVAAIDVLEHFTREELLELVAEIARVLRSDGRLIVHVPNGEAIISGAIRYGDLTHELAFTRHSLQQLANACGLKLQQVMEDRPVVHGFISGVRAMLWWLITLKFRLLCMAETGCSFSMPVLSRNVSAILFKDK